MLRRFLWTAILAAVTAAPSFAAEEPKVQPAPDEMPTRLIKVLRTTNKAQTNRYVPRVYDINNVNPYELLRWIRRTAQIEDGGYYFFGKPDAEGNVNSGKIMVLLPEYMLSGVDEMIKVIDREGLNSGNGDKALFFRPKHRSVTDAGFITLLQTIRGTTGDVVADTETNMVFLYLVASKMNGMNYWLPLIDVPPPQVMVEVTVYEIAVDNDSQIGLDYVSWKNGPGRNMVAFGTFYESENIMVQDGAPALLDTGVAGGTYALPGHNFRAKGANFVWFLDVPSAFFDFLVVKNKARVLTSAKIAARNLQASSISATDSILTFRTQIDADAAPGAGVRPEGVPADPTGAEPALPDNRTVVSGKTERVLSGRSGVSLVVTPTIAADEIDIDLVSTIVSHIGFSPNGAPILASRRTDTVVRARDGQEIVIGGMSRETFVQRSDKVPFFGSIPILGWFFGGESTRNERRQVVVVLTPHVIKDFGAMSYEATKINADLIKARATGATPVEVPKSELGFDQWLLDREN